MVLAAVRDGIYNLALVLHIFLVLVAFAPAFVHPILTSQITALPSAAQSQVLRFLHANGRRIYAPALILAGLLGFALQGMSEGAYSMGQTWIWLSIVLWIALNGVLHAVVLPGERAVADGDTSARSKVTIGGGVATLLLVVILVLMVYKPGL